MDIIKKLQDISVVNTTDISIFIQFFTLLFSGYGITYNLPEEHKILNRLLILETTVQIIELGFYLVLLRNMAKTVIGMAKTRYYDWVITTPTMLLTNIMYFVYIGRIENKEKPIEFFEFIEENKKNIIMITTANFLMLLSGYLYEIRIWTKEKAAVIGYIFFLLSFGIIYNNYASKTKFGKQLFALLFIIWGTYGIAFLMGENAKNNVINFLDLFAKNFFGIFLFFEARKHKI